MGHLSGIGFCAIQGVEHLNGGMVLDQFGVDVDERRSAKITVGSDPMECPMNAAACSEGLTVAFWLSLKHFTNNSQTKETCMLLSFNVTSMEGLQIKLDRQGRCLSFQLEGSKICSKDAYSATDDWVWNHYGLTWTSHTEEMKLFINGENGTTGEAFTTGEASTDGEIKGCSYVAFDEIAIWNRVLNESEMLSLRLDPFNATELPTTEVPSTEATTTIAGTTSTTTTEAAVTNMEMTMSASMVAMTTVETTIETTTTTTTSEPAVVSTQANHASTTLDDSASMSEQSSTLPAKTSMKVTPTDEASSPNNTPKTANHASTSLDKSASMSQQSSTLPAETATKITPADEMSRPKITQKSAKTLTDVLNAVTDSASTDEIIIELHFVAEYLYSGVDVHSDDGMVLEDILLKTGNKSADMLNSSSDTTRKNVLELFMGIVNGILEVNQNVTELTQEGSLVPGANLGAAVDSMLSNYIKAGLDPDVPHTVINPFVDIKLAVFEVETQTEITLEFMKSGHENQAVAVHIPRGIFATGQIGRVAATLYYAGIQEHLPAKLQGAEYNQTVFSPMVGINVNLDSPSDFSDKVSITITHPEVPHDKHATCAFLQITTKVENSFWSNKDCTTVSTTNTTTTCECNHLTNFAVLVSVRPIEPSPVLDNLSYIGLAISIICLILTLIILNVLRLLTSTRISILKHLAASLLIAQLLFVIGSALSKPKPEIFCKIVAALTHYSFLAVFCWMLVQGVHLYMKVRRALKSHIDLIYFCIFGWGFPLIIVAISFGIEHDYYGINDICWISVTEEVGVRVLLAFIAPAYFVLAINIIVMCMVMHAFLTVKVNKEKSEKDKIKSGIKAVAVMIPVLGLTWLFGILMVVNALQVVFSYFFVIFNCLQGLFIFLFHIIFNDEVKQAWAKKRNKIAATKEPTSLFSKSMKTHKAGADPVTQDTSNVAQ